MGEVVCNSGLTATSIAYRNIINFEFYKDDCISHKCVKTRRKRRSEVAKMELSIVGVVREIKETEECRRKKM
jgi:hypothetical protein